MGAGGGKQSPQRLSLPYTFILSATANKNKSQAKSALVRLLGYVAVKYTLDKLLFFLQ